MMRGKRRNDIDGLGIVDGSTKKYRIMLTEDCYRRLCALANFRNEFASMSDYVTASLRFAVDLVDRKADLDVIHLQNKMDPAVQEGFDRGFTNLTWIFERVYGGTLSYSPSELSCLTTGEKQFQVTISEGLMASAARASMVLNQNKVRPLSYFVRAAMEMYSTILQTRYMRGEIKWDSPYFGECVEGQFVDDLGE